MLTKWLISWLLFVSLLTQALPANKPRVVPPVEIVDSDVPCTSYADCSSKGYRLLTKLYTTVFQDEIIDRNDRSLFEKHYYPEFSHLQLPEKKFHLPLRNRGIEIVKMAYWAVYPKHPVTGVNERPGKQFTKPTQDEISLESFFARDVQESKTQCKSLRLARHYIVTVSLIEWC